MNEIVVFLARFLVVGSLWSFSVEWFINVHLYPHSGSHNSHGLFKACLVESDSDQVRVEVTQSSSPAGPGYVEYVCPKLESLF